MASECEETAEQKFFSNTLELIHKLISICHENGYQHINPRLIQLAANYLQTVDPKSALEKFIKQTHNYWDKFMIQDDEFFIGNSSDIFKCLPIYDIEDYIQTFNTLLVAKDESGNRVISYHDLDNINIRFKVYVKICINYIHANRNPTYIKKGDGYVKVYTKAFFQEVKNLAKLAMLFELELKWPELIVRTESSTNQVNVPESVYWSRLLYKNDLKSILTVC